MFISLFNQIKSHKPLILNVLLYGLIAFLAITIFCYGIFAYRIAVMQDDTNALDQKLLAYGSPEQKIAEKEVFDYKKKLDDFGSILNNHKVVSNVFTFMEDNTLSDVWFISFNVSEVKKEISLLGEAKSMEILSKQVKMLEANKEYVRSINILNSQIMPQGGVRFALNLSLNDAIFKLHHENQ